MRFLYLLLLPLCLFFSQVAPGAGLIKGLFHRYPEYQCAKKGGTCNFSPCPLSTKARGACYGGKAKCCI
ncbi:defensin beta 1 [Rhinolophus ferrumequinum]|uniref:Beta-defensin 1 n=1 Tax=Rhinolophus ferrumequinum TaxID=59479 RepID=A0A671F6J2_RHIFE|nr:beta-defensin 1 [Rhinolophus ferrumequinum]KAF6376110.1 defensin beta 1 [Rhinolophus ferrumequinum]